MRAPLTGMPVKVALELFRDASVGPKIKELEAKTVALRKRALATPSIMVHSRFQCPHPMLRELFSSDKIIKYAFHGNNCPPLRDFGASALHFVMIRDAEAALNSPVSPDILSYLKSNRTVHEAFHEAQEKWQQDLPETLQGDDNIVTWLKEDRRQVGKV